MATFKDLARTLRQIESELTIKVNKQLGQKAKQLIVERTRDGSGVNDADAKRPRKKRLKSLAESTIAQRRRKPGGGEGFSPEKSNLTYTGRLLKDLVVTADKKGFSIRGDRKRRRGGTTSEEIVDHQVSQGRPFLALTGRETDILVNDLTKFVKKKIRSGLR